VFFRQFVVPRVVLENLGKIFNTSGGEPVRALSSLTLSVDEGECLSLVGPSGSGKTTALRLIAGLDTPTTGSVRIGGDDMTRAPAKDRNVAMVFQQPALYPHMTVAENIGFGLKLRKWSRKDSATRTSEIADLLGLTPFLACLPQSLSGGQRQRVAIGRALASRASVLLLDEPLASIDPTLRNQMRSELVSLRKHFGTTLIYVTHDHIEAMLMGDRVAVLNHGVLQQAAPPVQLYQAPANLFVAGFVGVPPINLFTGLICQLNDHELWFDPSPVPTRAPSGPTSSLAAKMTGNQLATLKPCLGRQVVLAVRPEKVRFALSASSAVNSLRLDGKIISIEYTGPDRYAKIDCTGFYVVVRFAPETPVGLGDSCTLLLQFDDCSWFDAATGKALLHSCAC
jgi:multiple sugar transport system ATP-binding protein